MNDTITVIMATYNCASTVTASIESIIEQTYSNWKMIICDDGSSDNTYEVIKSYEAKFPEKIQVIRNDRNRKLPYSLNHCLKYVTTDLVARMDGDDVSKPERLERQVAYLKAHPEVDLVGTGVEVFDGKRVVGRIFKPNEPTVYDLAKASCFSHATILTYKRVYDALDGYSLKPEAIRVEDYELWWRFFEAGFKGASFDDILYTVLEDDSTMSRRAMKDRTNQFKVAYMYIRKLKLPLYYLIYPIKVVLTGLMPKFIYTLVHKQQLKKRERLMYD